MHVPQPDAAPPQGSSIPGGQERPQHSRCHRGRRPAAHPRRGAAKSQADPVAAAVSTWDKIQIRYNSTMPDYDESVDPEEPVEPIPPMEPEDPTTETVVTFLDVPAGSWYAERRVCSFKIFRIVHTPKLQLEREKTIQYSHGLKWSCKAHITVIVYPGTHTISPSGSLGA